MAEKTCDNCGSGKAVVHLTQIVNNEMTTFHLCEACAAEKGLEPTPESVNFPLTDFLAQMGGAEPAGGAGPSEACSFCGLTFDDFRETGRLGCPQCYSTFEPHLRGLLRRIHGSTKHVGKVYLPPDPTASEMEKRVEALRRKLDRAVAAENFERAAELRDEIRALEPTG
jgi:protein arginine kinase activator